MRLPAGLAPEDERQVSVPCKHLRADIPGSAPGFHEHDFHSCDHGGRTREVEDRLGDVTDMPFDHLSGNAAALALPVGRIGTLVASILRRPLRHPVSVQRRNRSTVVRHTARELSKRGHGHHEV